MEAPSVLTSSSLRASRALAVALGIVALGILIGSPLFGWFPVVRVSALLIPLLIIPALAAAPWRWSDEVWERAAAWIPSRWTLAGACLVAALGLLWIVHSRFQSGDINAVDFTVYFDRPLYQTSRSHWYLVESSDDPGFENLTHLAVHGYWILLPLAGLYRMIATPYWLLAVSVIAVVAGSAYCYRIVRHGGGSAVLALAAAGAFLLNDNTARTLNYGFHAEVLYAWFIPWAIDAALRRARVSFLFAVLATCLVKEDALFPLFGLSISLALVNEFRVRGFDRVLFLGTPALLGVLNLALFYTLAVPRLSPSGAIMYSHFWASHGATPWQAATNLLREPVATAAASVSSGLFSVVLVRHLFLPIVGWRWVIGLVPLLVVYGASDNQQVREFGIYYAIPLVPFLILASARGARTLTAVLWPAPRAEVVASYLLLLSALTVGLGYSVRPRRPELSAVKSSLDRFKTQQVLVQSGLYPHAGYDQNVKLLAPHRLRDAPPDEAVILLAPGISAYPFEQGERHCLEQLPRVATITPGLFAVRSATAANCLRLPMSSADGR